MQSRRSLLTISRTGEVQQITLLAAVHLTRADGRLLVQLGQVRDGSIEITGVLPGRRLQGGRVGEALQLVLGVQLAPTAVVSRSTTPRTTWSTRGHTSPGSRPSTFDMSSSPGWSTATKTASSAFKRAERGSHAERGIHAEQGSHAEQG